MKRKMELIVKHPNGYSGMLSGESSLAVFDNRMHEIIHTGDRNIETAEDLYDMLEDIPGFVEMMSKINFDVDFEDEEDDDI